MSKRQRHSGNFKWLLPLTQLGIGILLTACTDGRTPKAVRPILKQQFQGNTVTLKMLASVKWEGIDIVAYAMNRDGNRIFVTATGVNATGPGFMSWNIDQPEKPVLSFDTKALQGFAMNFPKIAWSFPELASGAIGLLGNTAILSGTAGVSLVDISSLQPKEIFRKPPTDATGRTTRDFAYTYKAIVPHPNGGMYYGFSEQESVYSVRMVRNDLQVVSRASYSPNGNVCCVRGAVLFQNTVYAAFGSRLAWFAPTVNGGMADPGELTDLQVSGIARADGYLILFHDPSSAYSTPQSYPRGFYYFDLGGNLVTFVPTNVVPKLFVTDPTGRYIYMQKHGGTDIEIHRVEGL